MWWRKKRVHELSPEDVFLDAKNLPSYDSDSFEGTSHVPVAPRATIVAIGVSLLFFIFIAGRVGYLQIARGAEFHERSVTNSVRGEVIIHERGVITDRNGVRLAWNEIDDTELPRRVYNSEIAASHLLGYVTQPARDSSGVLYQDEMIGIEGVEKLLNEKLSGKNGRNIIETDSRGNIVASGTIEQQQAGETVTLSIDSKLQNLFQEEIVRLIEENGFEGGAGVMMDVHTGEVLALMSVPGYDPNAFTTREDNSILSTYFEDERNPLLNRAVAGVYTPGSIVKPVMALGALESGVVTPERSFISTGSIRLQNPYDPELFTVFRDWKAHGVVDMRQAIAVSSNVYFYYVGGGFGGQVGMGIDAIAAVARKFGYGVSTGSGFPGEVAGVVPDKEWKEENFEDGTWRLGDTYHTVIGQFGFLATPLQVARTSAALATSKIVTPVFEKGVQGDVAAIDVDERDMQVIREGMRRAVTEGTSKGLDVGYLEIAGKTGTAELGVEKKLVNSWTTGYFPYDNPQYAYAIVMERGPVTNLVGATIAMRRVLDRLRTDFPPEENPYF